MWVRGAAIRPVPRYAIVDARTLSAVERDLADESTRARKALDGAFARFESTQPQLADTASNVLSRPLDETALALGYFLMIAVFLAFERAFGAARLREVSADAIEATEGALRLEEELRAANGYEPLDIDDIVSVEQPNVLSFVNVHVDAALEPRASGADQARRPEVDVADVHRVYRVVVLITLCLSHGVVRLVGGVRGRDELLA